eukprot:TRINITY_DN1308_c0_g6_i1.p1 TRINITY_DN1308_c0_g6~~TRINITY_DN1308_c0_g6_i1.p1  ORF type:complete len:543 (-),score=86.42 TRINITY_DN1308_c0_g6_i1:105-1733(-)
MSLISTEEMATRQSNNTKSLQDSMSESVISAESCAKVRRVAPDACNAVETDRSAAARVDVMLSQHDCAAETRSIGAFERCSGDAAMMPQQLDSPVAGCQVPSHGQLGAPGDVQVQPCACSTLAGCRVRSSAARSKERQAHAARRVRALPSSKLQQSRTLRQALGRLRTAISRAPREQRRGMLESLPCGVRKQLLFFMQTAPTNEQGSACGLSTRKKSSAPRVALVRVSKAQIDALLTRAPLSIKDKVAYALALNRESPCVIDVTSNRCQPGKRKQSQMVHDLTARKGRSSQKLSKAKVSLDQVLEEETIRGISAKKGGFSARIRLAPHLNVSTRCQPSREEARRCAIVLRRARQLLAALEPLEEILAADLSHALEQACKEAKMSPSQMGVSYCAAVDADRLLGRTISGSYSTDLALVLSQRRRLLVARDAGWPQLRQEWVAVMRCSTPVRAVWGRASLSMRSKAQAEAERVADEAWRLHKTRHSARKLAAMERTKARSWDQARRAAADAVGVLQQSMRLSSRGGCAQGCAGKAGMASTPSSE